MLSTIEKAIEAFAKGEIIIMTDDENRENEGDFVVAAEKATPDVVNFMVKHGRGLLCAPMSEEQLKKFGLAEMPRKMPKNEQSDTYSDCCYMESVDAAKNVTTGISAADRSAVIQILVSENGKAEDLVSPGHVFPLKAKSGGVLRRAGHTEGAVDMAILAGLRSGAVICEVLNDDGTMARLPELKEIAKEHKLQIISIEQIIEYRKRKEHHVELLRKVDFPSDYGNFVLHLFYSELDGKEHVALVRGDLNGDKIPIVRVHSECLTGDVFGSMRCDCGNQLHEAMNIIDKHGCGVLLYMRQEGRGIGLANKIHAYELQDQGMDTVEANVALGFAPDLRDYGIGAQILSELGIKQMKLLTNNPCKVIGLQGYGLDIIERLPIHFETNQHNEKYMSTKKEKMGHIF
ncbi:MAG: bifunctional 3,4-dihydroxy-2-butanone-4-phosphate synthase/GTP cyclohydrolase II [Kiritimatiellae bacterium]|jgi:3,4-dihydroxy 2-butanone 4-phosphate synthase/GTP cyclohydrolase II|nr:bifunctional 3,4-dihydroxy-2-butanone-4-phosphate synthase/GTP cyclohydrolase II [Kiritimatiellia bacterium]